MGNRGSLLAAILLATLGSALVVGCGGGGSGGGGYSTGGGGGGPSPSPSPSPSNGAQWTVMVYDIGANSLQLDQLVNVKAMEGVGSSASVNVVVQLDTGDNESPQATALSALTTFGSPANHDVKRFKIQKDSNFSADTLVVNAAKGSITPPTLVSPIQTGDDLGTVDMTVGTTIGDFVTWATKNNPAQHYALILCDHGGDWGGFGQDFLSGDLTVSYAKLQDLISSAAGALPTTTKTFDLLGFDACLMAGVEVAHMAQPYANVLVASEEEEIIKLSYSPNGAGWDYLDFLGDLSSNPSMTGRELATAILTRTGAMWSGSNGNPSFTLSAIDLTKVGQIATDFSKFTAAHASTILSDLDAIGQARAASADFDKGETNGVDPRARGVLVDFKDFLTQLSTSFPSDANLTATLADINNAMIGTPQHGALQPNANGLTLFMPLAKNSTNTLLGSDYSSTSFAQATTWDGYLNVFFTDLNGLTTAPQVTMTSPASGSTSTFASPGLTVAFAINGDNNAKSTILFTSAASFFGLVPGTVLSEIDLNQSGSLTGQTTWDGNLLVLTDGTTSVFMDLQPTFTSANSTTGNQLYYSQWQLTTAGGTAQQVLVLCEVDANSTAGLILGVFAVDSNGFTSLVPDEELLGASVQVISRTTNGGTSTSTTPLTITATSPINLRLGSTAAPSGSYTLIVTATDFAGNQGADSVNVTVP